MKRILCFGDSNTWGYIPEGGGERYDENTRWPKILQRELGEDFEVIEEGMNGRTSVFYDPVEDRMAGIDYFPSCVQSHAPLDLIILMLGVNDLKVRFSVSAFDIAEGFTRYLEAMKSGHVHGPSCEVLLISPIELDPSYQAHPVFSKMFGENGTERSKEFAEAFGRFAENNGLHFLDAAKHAKASSLDGLHLDAEAHVAFGKVVAERVLEII